MVASARDRMVDSYTYYLTTCIIGLLMFSCVGPLHPPSQSSAPHFRFATETTTIDTGTHKIRIIADEHLKYPTRVRFIVSGTAFAPHDYAFATKPFVLHTPNYPKHHVKNIIKILAGTNQTDISLTVKKRIRCEIKTIQLNIENLNGNHETLQFNLKHIPPPCVVTIAGDGTAGANNGLNTLTQFNHPHGLVVNNLGEIYVSDGNHIIRKIKPDGVTTTVVGIPGTPGIFFDSPAGLVFDTSNNLYVADTDNHRIRKITSGGVVSTLADTSAGFNKPHGVAIDASGNIYVADTDNHRIRKITPTGMVSALAGSGPTVGAGSFLDHTLGTLARFGKPRGVVIDASGNIYVADTNNHRIRKITPAGMVSTLAGGGSPTVGVGAGSFLDHTTGTSARFNKPHGVAIDASGNIYVADTDNHRIRKITSGGVVSTLAGTGHSGFMDGAGTSAQFDSPRGIAVNSSGTIYVTDYNNHRIRKIITQSPTFNPICTNGIASTIKLSVANIEKCVSCNSGFSLNGEICR